MKILDAQIKASKSAEEYLVSSKYFLQMGVIQNLLIESIQLQTVILKVFYENKLVVCLKRDSMNNRLVYNYSMRQVKQKQEPFFVKRVRLRKSIIKTNQILETISNYELQSNKYATISTVLQSQEIELKDRKSCLPLNRTTIDQFEFYATKTNRFNIKNMNNIIKLCNDHKNKEVVTEMSKAGLEVRRIIGDPEYTKRNQYSQDERNKHKGQKSCSRILNLTVSIDAFEENFSPSQNSPQKSALFRQSESSLIKCRTALSSNRRNNVYLYQKMAQMQKVPNGEQNHIYEKRIKSYTEFLWKCMLAHNIYIDLDLETASIINKKYKPCKAYIGFGNNSNMIKGLLKRRFWWVVSDQMTDDCTFIWTQIKINKIYQRQERAPSNRLIYSNQDIIADNFEDLRPTQSSNLKKRSRLRNTNEQFNYAFAPHQKIWNKLDFGFLRPLFKQKEFRVSIEEKQGKEKSYQFKTETVRKKYKLIKKIENCSNIEMQCQQQEHDYYRVKPLIHNHLQNNFFLGNKKALFYCLRQYYTRINEDVFDYVPLTFHIKEGFKDIQYKRFTKYYEERAKAIRRQEKGDHGKNKKSRNIWIVKPGQNSNQGRGITVIDELYELDRIIKQSQPKSKGKSKFEETGYQKSTFIVQSYIDKPLLYNDRKFDIRHYMLITNLYGITRAYWYEQGYIRTSAYRFNIHTFDPEIHLTNDAIQKHYSQYGRYQPANKISYSEFQNYLNASNEKKCHFKNEILTKMKKMGKDAARSIYGKMNPENQMHNFQIFGLDFMIDRNMKPWLIQVNTNPCLECVCPLLDRIIPYMVEQAFKLSIDLVYPPPTHYPNTCKHYAPLINLQNFKYELIFDSISEGEEIQKIFSKQSTNFGNLVSNIGVIEQDEQFKDEGKEMKLEDFT